MEKDEETENEEFMTDEKRMVDRVTANVMKLVTRLTGMPESYVSHLRIWHDGDKKCPTERELMPLWKACQMIKEEIKKDKSYDDKERKV